MATGIHYWPHLLEMTEEQCKAKLRCMELEAYGCVVSVLRARGPLTEEKLAFMKQCAKEFHISQERHKVEIRKASNSELLSTIAEMLYGPNTETKWFIEGRRLVPVIATEPRQSVYIELANTMAELARAHNASLPSYSEYKDDMIEVQNAHLKDEEEALVKELENTIKLKEQETIAPPVTSTSDIVESIPSAPSPQHSQVTEAMEEGGEEQEEEEEEEEQEEEMTERIVVVGEDEEEDRRPPPAVPPRKERAEGGAGRSKTPPARKKKRSISIEMYNDSSTPPKRFSNIPPPRIPATPVSQRPARFPSMPNTPSSQPSPRIVVLPGMHHQPHSSMTHINTSSGSSVRKPLMKSSGPPPPPIISKIQRPPRMFTPIKTLNFTPGTETGGPGSERKKTSPHTSMSGAVVSSSASSVGLISTSMSGPNWGTGPNLGSGPNSGSGPNMGSGPNLGSGPNSGSGPPGKNNLILLQKSNKPSGSTTTTTTPVPNRITIANPNKKEPNKFVMNKPSPHQTNISTSTGPKSMLLKTGGSTSQNNVILVDITQDQLSGNLSMEELLKVSGLSTASTVTHTSGTKSTTASLPNIIKLQNPKSLGSLPANIQQIKIIKSSGSKIVFPPSVGCLDSVLSIAQSSSTSTPSTVSRMLFSPHATWTPAPRPPKVTPTSTRIAPIPSPIPSPRVVPSHVHRAPTARVTPGKPPAGMQPVGKTSAQGKPMGSAPAQLGGTKSPGNSAGGSKPSGQPAMQYTPGSKLAAHTAALQAAGSKPNPAMQPGRPAGTTGPRPAVATPSGGQRNVSTPSTTTSGGATQTSTAASSSSNISSGSQLADWLSNYVVSDKDIESDNSPLFEDVSDKN